MALAFIYDISGITPLPATTELDLTIDCAYAGSDVPLGGEIRQFHVIISDSETNNTFRNKMTDAAVAEAAGLGFTVSRTSCLMPSYQKGV